MSEHKSPAYRLLALVAEESQHTTWRNINPARSDHGHLSKGWRVTSILPDGFRLKRAPREEIRNYDGTVASEASPGRMVFVSRADLVAATTESKARAKAAKRRGQGEESNEAIEGDVRRMT